MRNFLNRLLVMLYVTLMLWLYQMSALRHACAVAFLLWLPMFVAYKTARLASIWSTVQLQPNYVKTHGSVLLMMQYFLGIVSGETVWVILSVFQGAHFLDTWYYGAILSLGAIVGENFKLHMRWQRPNWHEFSRWDLISYVLGGELALLSGTTGLFIEVPPNHIDWIWVGLVVSFELQFSLVAYIVFFIFGRIAARRNGQ